MSLLFTNHSSTNFVGFTSRFPHHLGSPPAKNMALGILEKNRGIYDWWTPLPCLTAKGYINLRRVFTEKFWCRLEAVGLQIIHRLHDVTWVRIRSLAPSCSHLHGLFSWLFMFQSDAHIGTDLFRHKQVDSPILSVQTFSFMFHVDVITRKILAYGI